MIGPCAVKPKQDQITLSTLLPEWGKTVFDRRNVKLTNNTTNNSLKIPFPSYPAVQKIRCSGVHEEREGPEMVVVDDKVADHRRGEETGKGEEVRDVPNLLMALDGSKFCF